MNRHCVLPALVLAATSGCSSGGSTSGGAGGPTVSTTVSTTTVQTSGGDRVDFSTSEDRDVIEIPVRAPLDSVWRLLPGIFLELGIEPGTVNQSEHYIANTSFVARRTLGGQHLSRYLECGETLGSKTANQAQVRMSVTVQAVANGSGATLLRSQVQGTAVSDGVVTNAIHCATTGGLEARIARMVTDELARRAKH